MTEEASGIRADVSQPQRVQESACTAIAFPLENSVDATGFPTSVSWAKAKSICFDADWQGKNADSHRGTEVALLWTPETLYLKFISRYRLLTVFEDPDVNGRRDRLWERDVVEVFLQPDPHRLRQYQEFEVSPNGLWIDLNIDNGALENLHSGVQRRVSVDAAAKSWTAELAIPMKCLVQHFEPRAVWRVNFYRIEGPAEPRFYSAWQSTNTPQPNFHVPERFGYLQFASAE